MTKKRIPEVPRDGSEVDFIPQNFMLIDGAEGSAKMRMDLFAKASSVESLRTDVSGKADKVTGATKGDVATLDANGNLVDSGKMLGTSVPADAVFTDAKVTQTKTDSAATAYPLLMAGTVDPSGDATTARYDSDVKLTPSTNTITANISGNAATATSADTATTASTLSASSITSGDLNDYRSGGNRYFCNSGNSSNVSNKPSGVTGAFALDVIAHSDGITQLMYSRNSNYSYIRCYTDTSTWTAWDRFSLASDANGVYFATYGSTSRADVLAAIQEGKAVFCISGTEYAPLTSISSGGVITFAKSTPNGVTIYYQLSTGNAWTSGTSTDCRVAFSAVTKSENTSNGCTLTFTAINGSTKSVTVRNAVNAGNADTVGGYHIVVGSTGTDSKTIYFT